MSRSKLVLVLFALAVPAAIAGCVTPPATDTPPGTIGDDAAALAWAKKALVFGEGHDHRKWEQHVGLSTPNFQELAYDPLATKYYGDKSAVGYFCGGQAQTKDGRKLTVISSLDSDVAFVLVDVTDPMKPTKLGEYVLEGVTHYDVDITSDGSYVVIGADPNPKAPGAASTGAAALPAPLGTMTVQPRWRDACTGEERDAGPESALPIAPATVLVNIKDPKNPVLVDALPAPVLGPHSVSTAKIGDATYVASSITNLAHHGSYFQFSQILDTPTGGKLVQLSVVDSGMYGNNPASPQSPFSELGNGHVDAEIAMHPVTKKPVAYLSNWDGGMVILDFSNPAAPTMLSSWADKGTDGGAVHSTRSIAETWDGKHYVLAGQEFVARPKDRPSGWMYVIDDTDPTKPKEVGRWTLPVDSDPYWGEKGKTCCLETFSTHYFRVQDRIAFMAMYHGGVWAIDLSTPEDLAAPKSVGVFVPDKAPPAARRQPTGGYDLTPFVLDVFPNVDHTLTIFDGYSGVYSVRFDPGHPMPAPPVWPKEGKAHDDG